MEIFNYYFELPSEIPALNVTSLFFIVFVFVASLLLFFNDKLIRNAVIFATSCIFIWSFSKDCYFLLVSLAFCIYGYISSLILNKVKIRWLFWILAIEPIIFLLGFKGIIGGENGIIVPLGISFYVLRLVWYLRQVYNNELKFDLNPLYVFNYLIFFPCFSAGPIEKPDHFINQLKVKGNFSFSNIREGWFRFLYGVFEKIVICDFIGTVVDRILPVHEVVGITVFVGIILYSFQIYLDFDSYSNIAIGVSKIFGLNVNENFKTPYLSKNIKEFWSRWHISLSTWLKENIYLPLGGNRKGNVRKIINICLVFIVSGLWHGSTFNFILWGLLHALIRILEDFLEQKLKKFINIDFILFKPIRILINFFLVTFLWVIFKYENLNDVLNIFGRLFSFSSGLFSNVEITHNEIMWLTILLIYVVLVDIIRYFVKIFNLFSKAVFPIRYVFYVVGIVIVLIFGVYGGSFNSADFIYRWF